MQLDLKIASYDDSDYRPSAWLTFMLTSKPAGKDALLTMLPRMDSDNVVLTQNKQVRRAARDNSRAGQAAPPQVILKPPAREVTMFHKIARNAVCDPTALLKRKLDAFASQIILLEAAGHHDRVQYYKRLQLEASTEMCDELIKLSNVTAHTTSSSSSSSSTSVIDLLNSSTSSASLPIILDHDEYNSD